MLKFSKLTGLLLAASMASLSMANVATAKEPVAMEVWALRTVVGGVTVSPDGKHVALMKIASKEGNRILEIYKTDDFSKPFRRLDAKPMEFGGGIRWVSDNIIVGSASKVVKKRVSRPEDDVRKYKIFAYNVETNKFSEASGTFSIIGNLPNDPDNVLIQTGRAVPNSQGVDPFAAFRPRSYYKFNLKTGARSLVLKGNSKIPGAGFDIDGNPVFSQSRDQGSHEIISYYRLPGDKNWKEFEERVEDTHENLYKQISGIHGYQGTKHGDPSIAYIVDNRDGSDKAALWEFDLKVGKFTKKLYENADADVIGLQYHSNSWSGNRKLVAAIYPGAKYQRHWFDMEEKALFEQLEAKIPNGHFVTITSRSRDGNTMVVRNVGPKDPGTYYFIQDGKMAQLGSSNPLVSAEDLSDVSYVRYQARDGLTIPAYITKPEGKGPFPTIILPHGGPHINEVILYDEWSQFLANNGYLVMQPQYRISTGWGKKHFDAGYGEHGYKMQDDKDDGAKYLIAQGLADPDRIAMFGYSYGGYAAHVAASREDQLYQCTIAGAAVGDARKRYHQRKGPPYGTPGDEWSKRRGAYEAIDPIKEIPNLNIPQLIIHGTVDFRVEYFNATDYMKAAKKAGKGHLVKLLTLKGAGHTITTHYYKHNIEYYPGILDYLKNDCGPGGL